MIINTHDLENDRAADEAAELEDLIEAMQAQLSDDLFEAYFDENDDVVTEIDFVLAEPSFFKALRENFTADGVALRSAFRKQVALACDATAKGFDTVQEIEKFRADNKV